MTTLLVLIGSLTLASGTGGGIGTTPPPPPNPDFANTLAVDGDVALADGAQSLVFTLTEASGSDFVLPTTVFQETQSVTVTGGRFSTRLGRNTPAGIPSELLAGNPRLSVRWAAAANPAVTLGSMAFFGQPVALTLAPDAVIESHSGASPGLAIDGVAAGLSATSSSSSSAALVCSALSTYGATAGVEGVAASLSGAGGAMLNSGGGDLLQGRNAQGATAVLRVANDGSVWSKGVLVPQFGSKGVKGDTGDKGPTGDPGATGPTGNQGPPGTNGAMGSFAAVCVLSPAGCSGVCRSPASLSQSMQATANNGGCGGEFPTGGCYNYAVGSWCCVCE